MPRQARYREIAHVLGRSIESGELAPGERLPTEDALAERYGVHRLTARQAMVELRKAGLVETRQGLGSFVRRAPRRIEVSVDPETRRHRPSDIAGMAGLFTGGERLVERGEVAHPAAAGHLRLPGGVVHEITTLLRNGERPCVLSRYRLASELAGLRLDPKAGVLASLEAAGHAYRYAWHAISAEPADLHDQSMLEMEAGEAVLVREGLLTHDGRPVCHVERRCRGDMISFVTRYD
ncbi:GntR family transcriptional regulator [Nonomuraea spiralis]|uniref:GntR family transcriptional regulator n=1 Tax=Nonomuraea spiralis TaxID=46182 RepID=A0ABV5IIV9_9ACTN|nr:GntR family transcriptional regulator [Nonomuraea spiralis]GGT13026.1 GntR family transcriptional regulator [Nonomuraea spiralis]